MRFKLPFIPVGYYCPTFKVKKSRLSEVLEPVPGHTVSCKAGLEPCPFLYSSPCIYTALIFMDGNPPLAELNGEAHGSTLKRLQRGCTPVTVREYPLQLRVPQLSTELRNQIHGGRPEARVPSTLQEIWSPDHQRAMSIPNPSNTASLKCTWGVLLSLDVEDCYEKQSLLNSLFNTMTR